MAHHHKLAGAPWITQNSVTLQPTYYWLQIAADVPFAAQDCVHCTKHQVSLHKRAKSVELFLAFEPLKSVSVDILGLLANIRSSFQYIIMTADRLTKLF